MWFVYLIRQVWWRVRFFCHEIGRREDYHGRSGSNLPWDHMHCSRFMAFEQSYCHENICSVYFSWHSIGHNAMKTEALSTFHGIQAVILPWNHMHCSHFMAFEQEYCHEIICFVYFSWHSIRNNAMKTDALSSFHGIQTGILPWNHILCLLFMAFNQAYCHEIICIARISWHSSRHIAMRSYALLAFHGKPRHFMPWKNVILWYFMAPASKICHEIGKMANFHGHARTRGLGTKLNFAKLYKSVTHFDDIYDILHSVK